MNYSAYFCGAAACHRSSPFDHPHAQGLDRSYCGGRARVPLHRKRPGGSGRQTPQHRQRAWRYLQRPAERFPRTISQSLTCDRRSVCWTSRGHHVRARWRRGVFATALQRCDRFKKNGPSLAPFFLHQQLPQRFGAIERHLAKRAACKRKMQLTSHNAQAPRSTYEPLQNS